MAGFLLVKCVYKLESLTEEVDGRSGLETDDVWIDRIVNGVNIASDAATAVEVQRHCFLFSHTICRR